MELVEFQMYRSMKNDESLQSGKLSTILSLHSFSLDQGVFNTSSLAYSFICLFRIKVLIRLPTASC